MALKSDFDILCISETWFKPAPRDTNASVEIEGYRFYRLDRPKKEGGGVCAYIKSHLKARILKDLTGITESGLHQLYIQVQSKNLRCIVLGVIYRPPEIGVTCLTCHQVGGSRTMDMNSEDEDEDDDELETNFFKSWRRVVGPYSKKFRTRTVEYVFVTNENQELRGDGNEERALFHGRMWVDLVFQRALLQIYEAENLQPRDRVNISILGGDLTYPLTIPYHPFHSPEHQQRSLMDVINRIQQSKKEWMMGATLTITISVVQSHERNGRKLKNNGVTQERFMELEERKGITKVLNWSITLKRILQRFGKKDSNDDNNDDDWCSRLSKWCQLYPDINVLVLGQEQGWGEPHTVLWKSQCHDLNRVVVLWKTADNEWYEILSPNALFTGRLVLCLKCGQCCSSYKSHRCSEEEFNGLRKYKRKAHFKCTEKELKRKKRCRYDCDMEQNCLGASLFQAMKEWKYELNPTIALQDWFAELKMDDTWNQPSDLETVKRWAQILQRHYSKPIELIVYDTSLKEIQARFGGENEPESRSLFLEYDRHHFTWIRSMAAWMGYKWFCRKCMKGYNNSKETHKCNRDCIRCGHPQCHPQKDSAILCEDCGIRFGTTMCFFHHKKTRDKKGVLFTQCERRFKCTQCYCIVDRWSNSDNALKPKSSHRCFQYNCNICGVRDVTRGEHQCFIQTEQHREHDFDVSKRPMKLAFFDFETRCLEEHHIVNKVVVLLVCNQCQDHIEEWKTRGCTGSCGRKRLWIFDTINEFLDWLLGPMRQTWMDYTFLAHNFKGYDSYPILEGLVKRNICPTSCVYQGTKLLTMTVNGIIFKDSLCFIPMALRQFPAAFGTSGGKKGYFPHFFNKKENEHYIGPYPPLQDYGYDEMTSESEKKELKEWWLTRQNQTMNFQQELTEYCIQDVLVMMRGCLKYHELIVSLYGVSPFQEAVTLASTCMKVFLKNFLHQDMIGIVPPMGYRPRDVYSHQSMEWLYSLGIPHLRSALSPLGEKTLLGDKVDGYDDETKTVYQYHGCYWHGCDCFQNRFVKNPHLGKTMLELKEQTEDRTRALRQAGYFVVEMWSHIWDVERVQHTPFPREVTCQFPLQPRQALMGGRTNAIHLYAYTDEIGLPTNTTDEILQTLTTPSYRIRYIDVVSLYPTVMKQERFPVGHPTILTVSLLPSLEECIDNVEKEKWFGLVKVDVDPPHELFFPVLPMIIHQRLMFGLCRTCMQESNEEEEDNDDKNKRCPHSKEQRRLLDGVWTTFELKKALEKGYQIHAFHEVWHYSETTQTLFSDYINQNLKLKMEASGWPSRCQTDQEKQEFLKEVQQRENLKLDPEKVAFNPGMRYVAKLFLNSLWGKFAQNEQRSKTEYVNEAEHYFKLLYSDVHEVNQVILLDQGEMAQVTFTEKKEVIRPLQYGNVVLASCVTSWARLKLYEMLEKLNFRVLYHDTDSIIYKTQNEEDEEIQTGSSLGQWEDECKDPQRDWLIEFVSIGPKSYAYRTHKGGTYIKCKGITLTESVREKVHLQSMKEMVVEKNKTQTVSYPRRIERDSVFKHLRTVSTSKCVQLVYTKRQFLGENLIRSYPFGY
ncbi:uncharacterized protein LOC110252733 [Exaiptasia diaphana]|uniref:DNA-directed DNA polymerase n=1 Tax=Exaiptasia diaphana TaxID=2652724 RepID=A0A913YYC3_EXADI|nr:uncharacterized protein LOC110252733 [Exaiptasia diaphana]